MNYRYIGGLFYLPHLRANNYGRVVYKTTVHDRNQDGTPGQEIGFFEIEGAEGAGGVGFDEGPGIQPMNMTIDIEDEWQGHGISRQLIRLTCGGILAAIGPESKSKLVFIDTDASVGFWVHIGLVPTEAIRDGLAIPAGPDRGTVGAKRKPDEGAEEQGVVGWLTEEQVDLIRSGYGEGYEAVISLGALYDWSIRRPIKKPRASRGAATG